MTLARVTTQAAIEVASQGTAARLTQAVTAVTLFTDRVRQAMVLRAKTLLAADLVLDSSFPIVLPYLEEARRLGLAGTDAVVSQHPGGRRADAAHLGPQGRGSGLLDSSRAQQYSSP